MIQRRMSPVLKWAGGKSQLLECIMENMPAQYGNYHEPFLGGAAVLLGISPWRASVSDINEQLINLYIQLRDAAESVIDAVKGMDARPCDKEIYYAVRERYNEKIAGHELDAECAALMIWLNKHCFNGLYRVNGKGLFNVPYNNKTSGKSIDEDNVRAISRYLRDADISIACLDFEKACQNVQPGDFVYLDSPYVPQSATASFTDYTMDGFTLSDHERLAALFRRLDGIGAKVMLSNNDVPLVRELYAGYGIQSVEVKRLINRNAGGRTGREVLVTNY